MKINKQEIQERISRFSQELSPFLSAGDREDVNSFVDAAEWSLALDLVLFLIEKRDLKIDKSLRASAYSLAEQIGMNLEVMRSNWPRS